MRRFLKPFSASGTASLLVGQALRELQAHADIPEITPQEAVTSAKRPGVGEDATCGGVMRSLAEAD
jgi:hypothetical protein